MSWTADAVVVVVSAGAGFGTSWLTNRRDRRTEAAKAVIDRGAIELDARRIDGEAIERAQRINEAIVQALQEEVSRLEATIDGLRRDLTAERQRSTELEGHIRQLEDSAATMRRLLRDAGVEYPPKAEVT
jgi:hypothetical protein